MRKYLLLLCFVFSILIGQLPVQAATTLGPFLPNPACSLYLISDGKPITARLTIRRGPRAEGDRVMVRAFNPQEQLTFWQYAEPGKMADTFGPGDMEVWGIPLQIPVKPQPGDLLMDTELQFNGRGVHQLRISAGTGNVLVSLTLPRPLGYGVSFQNGNYAAWEGQPATMYAYVPPHAEELQVTGGLVTIADAAGKDLARTEDASLQKWVTIPVTQTDAIWTVKFPQVNNWLLRAAGFPFILCPTPEAAKTIHASVELLPDGTVVCHKFQRRIAELLPKLLDPKRVGKAENLIVPLASRKEAWLANPVRNENLLSAYALMPSVAYALRSQNVDPKSHWSGAIEGWQELLSKPAPGNRWDRLRSVPGIMRSGASPYHNAIAENLAQAALLDAPFNPYFGKKELLYRAAASALRDLMMLGEDEVWRGCDADQSAYPGMMAFAMGQKTLPVFRVVAPLMPDDVRAVWTEGVRHIIDRSYPDYLVTCRNQSSHYLTAYQDFAIGSGDAHYLDLARAYARRFVQGAHPAGFYIEQCGPDGSYIGMTHWHMAMYYRESQDPTILEGLRRSYRFFNHTVAPEPDGKMLGGFNFNHRIAAGFYDEQWGGAKGILDNVLPEVGLWAGPALSPEKQAAKAQQSATNITKHLATPNLRMEHSNIVNPRYEYYTEKPDRTGVWPACEKADFIRDLTGELVAVKRAGYYAVVYVGKPAPSKHYISGREYFRTVNAGESTAGGINYRKITPYLGGGLSMFWTPSYGSALLASNWAPTTHHGLIALQADGKRYWEDYFATRYQLDQKAGILTVTGRIENLPIAYTRQYRFAADEIEIHVTLRAEQAVSLTSLTENIPFAEGAMKARGVELTLTGEKDGQAQTDRFTLRDTQNAGVEVLLDGPRPLRIQRNGLRNGDLQFGRVEVVLPAQLAAGQQVELIYHVRPLR